MKTEKNKWRKVMIRISLSSIIVEDQDKALKFYTEVLGFEKKTEIPLGEYKWLTVVSPDGPDDVELALEPTSFAPAKTFQKALYDAGIPYTAFETNNIEEEYKRLKDLGVVFRGKPEKMGTVTGVVFEDTCNNLINLYQA
jgi:catechol 2,3-dioxygenase-like lactoylglutathione lyase family enzyme